MEISFHSFFFPSFQDNFFSAFIVSPFFLLLRIDTCVFHTLLLNPRRSENTRLKMRTTAFHNGNCERKPISTASDLYIPSFSSLR